MSAFLEPRYFFDGPFRIFEAATRSSLIAERQRAKTASAMVGAGTPMSRALVEVHLPVPFWPAVSRTTSTKGFFGDRILLLQDVGRDLDQEAVEDALVPLGENRAHLGGLEAEQAAACSA